MIKINTITILILLILINNAYAFKFDMWRSGINIDNIFEIARKYNLPLRRSGIIATNKIYKSKMCEPYKNINNIFYYPYILLGEKSNIILNITPKSKLLYMVSIEWISQRTGYKSTFYKKVNSIFEKRYKCSPNRRKLFFLNKKCIIDNNNIINILGSSGQTKLIYKDKKLMKLAIKESKKEQIKKENFQKDINKF